MTDPARRPPDRPSDWARDLEAELRELGRDLDVPAAPDLTADVRRRLDRAGPPAEPRPGRRRGLRAPHPDWRPVGRRFGWPVGWPVGWWLRWRVAVPVALALLAVLAVTPPGRAVVTHVFRFAGIELRQEPGPVPTPTSTTAPGNRQALPGEQVLPLDRARRVVTFPILVPAPLGVPDQVAVSDGGRVASLVYRRTPYGEVRVDEFDGHVDAVLFRKFLGAVGVTAVHVRGRTALWVERPHEVVYVRRDGTTDVASARLTTGSTLIWETGRVVLRLEGRIGKDRAIAIATVTTRP